MHTPIHGGGTHGNRLAIWNGVVASSRDKSCHFNLSSLCSQIMPSEGEFYFLKRIFKKKHEYILPLFVHRKFKASTPKQTLSLCVFALHTEYTSGLVHAGMLPLRLTTHRHLFL